MTEILAHGRSFVLGEGPSERKASRPVLPADEAKAQAFLNEMKIPQGIVISWLNHHQVKTANNQWSSAIWKISVRAGEVNFELVTQSLAETEVTGRAWQESGHWRTHSQAIVAYTRLNKTEIVGRLKRKR